MSASGRERSITPARASLSRVRFTKLTTGGSCMWQRIWECLLGGTRSLNDSERRIRATLIHQVGMIRKVQRSNPGRMVTFYYTSTADVPRLPFEADDDAVSAVSTSREPFI